MQGERRYADANGHLWLNAGQYGWDARIRRWMAVTPNGHWGDLSQHQVTEHDDGTITVHPSIRVSDGDGELWHGWLERGMWRQA